jgi:predicted nucleotidyltransferase
MIEDKIMNKLVDIIVDEIHPNKIILFGSRARGDNREDSDYDLLVLKDDSSEKRKLTQTIYRSLLKHRVGVSVDALVMSAEKYEELSKMLGFVYINIRTEGKVIYEYK